MAATRNLAIEAGASFAISFTWQIDGVPQQLTGWTAALHMRRTYDDAEPSLDAAIGGSGRVEVEWYE